MFAVDHMQPLTQYRTIAPTTTTDCICTAKTALDPVGRHK